MTELLCKLFVKNHDDPKNTRVRSAYGSLASIVGIILNIILATGKMTIGIVFGAISITSDGVNNLSDALSQIISLISFKIATKPADRDHPYGHARIEYVASMIVSFIILLVAWELGSESVGKLVSGEGAEFSPIMIIVLAISIAIKLWLAIFNRKIGKKINSTLMLATSTDSLSDAIATFAVLVAMVISKITGFVYADGIMGIFVALFIFKAGIGILNETKNSILGGKPDPELVENIRSIINEYPEALGIHDMFIHSYGPGRNIVSLHVEVDGEANIFELHDAIDLMEKRLYNDLSVIATIHMDPIVTNDEYVNEMRGIVKNLVSEIDNRLDIHDFRFVMGQTHTNLIFDVAAPFEMKMTDLQIKETIEKKISEYNDNYFAVITVDRN